MEGEVDEGLEEEDAMVVGPLRGGDESGERAGGLVWFGLAFGVWGSNESLAESVVFIVACPSACAAPVRCAKGNWRRRKRSKRDIPSRTFMT